MDPGLQEYLNKVETTLPDSWVLLIRSFNDDQKERLIRTLQVFYENNLTVSTDQVQSIIRQIQSDAE